MANFTPCGLVVNVLWHECDADDSSLQLVGMGGRGSVLTWIREEATEVMLMMVFVDGEKATSEPFFADTRIPSKDYVKNLRINRRTGAEEWYFYHDV